ncbi:MAG: zinc ABC transporter ATP-binding protein [Candidatus Staskawiczbacteria bacterium RIFCSPLOWO2_01_FULL_40_39]|uniref:Zinc ABC transporter ATP-binding protein n=1 Tax=Candidatus Staskawiczbacteria bacterium RIFCSPHIGHO2_01_FULL_39_25 TaxID=1802202 RepID=A0A1G2HPA6_9BACT|nr:MAG: zinc ABC transporter ATP-binding protein [Candidatus Staskawiczbacteria bacterium RIFCSPHIGHO2_01_FULL_39_25]OGZ73656.1 MAG: zinc ABC transporter ATP-binding protein [Candidatus Staskawiczbacteria bacterium RIFCSPLOWO2_01_FULL_40_39]
MQAINHTKNIVEVNNVSFHYGSYQVLKDITFNIHKGDYLGIVGPNGAGKTTLIKIILGLLNASKGSVKLFETDSKSFKNRSLIGYVPQKATNFDMNFPATVMEVVLMGTYARRGLFHKIRPEDRQSAEQALKQVRMWQYKDSLIGDLSGGQQQRVFIARALASRPEIIFLDEPTTSIDKKSQDGFYALLKELNQKEHLTLVIVSHDIERITKEAMHIACVDCTLVCHASPEEFLKESKSLNLFGQEVKIISHHHSNNK